MNEFERIIVYLDGAVGVRHFKKHHHYCKFILSPYDDETQRRGDVKWELATPSEATWSDCNFSFDEGNHHTWDEFTGSEKLNDIYDIIGRNPLERRDGLHLDSAFKSKSEIFLTADWGNIINHRPKLEALLGFCVFDPFREKDLLIMRIEELMVKKSI